MSGANPSAAARGAVRGAAALGSCADGRPKDAFELPAVRLPDLAGGNEPGDASQLWRPPRVERGELAGGELELSGGIVEAYASRGHDGSGGFLNMAATYATGRTPESCS